MEYRVDFAIGGDVPDKRERILMGDGLYGYAFRSLRDAGLTAEGAASIAEAVLQTFLEKLESVCREA